MKVRIGLGTGGAGIDADGLASLAGDLDDLGFDSLWLPEVLTAPGFDPMVGLAWVAGRHRRLKIGTTMLLPGRNLIRLAKQVASLDALSGGKLLLTFVPGLAQGPERQAIGVPPSERGAVIDEVMPVLRALWAGEEIELDGPSGQPARASISPLPVQQPIDVWLGGMARSSLVRCGRLADGWLPAMCSPAEAAGGRKVIEEEAAAAGRRIDPEHFGVSVGYATGPLDDRTAAALAARAKGRPLEDRVPVGLEALRELLEGYIAVGFSKFVVRPLVPPANWRSELEMLASAVGDLQT